MKTYRGRVLRRHPLALAVCCVLAGAGWPAAVQAQNVLPQGPSVRHGAATINTVTVGNSQHMVVDSRTPGSKQTFIDWRGFSIGTGNSVRFEQPDAASLVVNRVLGGSESGIFGGLSSNGRVWLLNPYGIYFGAGSTINVGGLVASTLYADLNSDSPGQLFSSKSLALYQDSSGEGPVGTITNLGTIKAGSGHVALVSGGGGVLNYGTISNPGGRITLLAGTRVQVLDPGLPNLSFVLDPAHYRGAVVNSPYADGSEEVPTRSAATLEVGSGRVDMAAAIVNQAGIVRADAADGAGGTVDMRAHILTVPDGSLTSASGQQRGGEIRLQTVPLQRPIEGYWGDLAGRLLVEPKAELRADAVDRGNGGLIAIQAATAATVDGRLSASGGKAGGDGGRVELSAHSIELRDTAVQASSAGGRPGVLSITSVADSALTERIAAPALVSGGSDPPLFYLRQPLAGDLLESRVRTSVVADALSGGTSVELRVEGAAGRPGTGNLYVGFGSPINTKEPVPMTLAVSHASAEPLSFTLAASGNLTLAQTSLLFDGRPVDVRLLAGAAPLRGGAAPSTTASAVLSGSRVISAGRISLGGERVGLRSGSYLSSSAAGDAIVIHGPDRRSDFDSPFALGSAGRFINEAGPQALRSPAGRWLVYATSRDGEGAFDAGGLVHDATYLGERFVSSLADRFAPASTPAAKGALLLFSEAGFLFGNADARITPARDYNALRDIDLRGTDQVLGLTGGDRVLGFFADAHAGVRKPISLRDPTGRVQAWDSQDKPVFGYQTALDPGIRGTVTPLAVRLADPSAASRPYDGTRDTTVQAAVLGTVGSETLRASALGTFDTADAGTGKPVTAEVTLANGSNGGLAANYRLPNGAVSAAADVTPRPISIASASAADKVYDGNTTASVGASLAGLVAGEALQVSASGQFADAHAGTGKAVTGSVTLASSSTGRISNYHLADATLATTASIQPRPLTLGSVVASDKTYDRSDAASVQVSLQGLVANEQLQWQASGRFDAIQAGARQVQGRVSLADGLDGSRATNYVLGQPAFATTASILPRGIGFDATVDNKVYDGLTLASVSAWRLQGLLGADQVQVAGGQARFDDAQAGRAKPVLASVSGLAGADAANYRLDSLQGRTQADITPATLTYVADPAVRRLGQPIDDLRGSVTGFVGGETLASSTRGQLRFVPREGGVARSGLQAVDGGGLSAANYRFQQAPANDTALLVLPPDPPTQPGTAAVTPPVRQRLEADRNLTDLVGAMNGDGRQQVHFGALDVTGKSPSSLAAILDARGRYKKLVLADALRQLESDPDQADAPPCLTLEQADTGRCLVGEVVLAQVAQATGRPVASAATPAVPATTPSAAATAAGPAAAPAGPSTAPAAASAAAAAPSLQQQVASGSGPIDLSGERAPAAGLPRPSAASAVLQELLKAPPVRAAALPQIQRKLAVVIGIDNYADKQIPSLDGARRDAEGVANVLSTALGYETALILDGSREAILRRLNRLVLQAGPEDSVVIYYAGHGDVVEKTKQGYWIPANARIDDPRTWISNNDIGRVIGRIPSRQVALISDSCFSGSLVGGPGIAAAAVQADPLALLRRRAAVVMTSGGNEPVADTGKDGHSVFTYNLMRSLQGLDSWRPGNNVFASVSAAVARTLPQRPRYAAVMMGRHEAGSDYLFELRQLAPLPP